MQLISLYPVYLLYYTETKEKEKGIKSELRCRISDIRRPLRLRDAILAALFVLHQLSRSLCFNTDSNVDNRSNQLHKEGQNHPDCE